LLTGKCASAACAHDCQAVTKCQTSYHVTRGILSAEKCKI